MSNGVEKCRKIAGNVSRGKSSIYHMYPTPQCLRINLRYFRNLLGSRRGFETAGYWLVIKEYEYGHEIKSDKIKINQFN